MLDTSEMPRKSLALEVNEPLPRRRRLPTSGGKENAMAPQNTQANVSR
jgi:hypothetical protein